MTQVYELRAKIYLQKNISDKESLKEVGKLIDKCLCQNEKYKKLHNENRYKNYVFNGFYPIERDGMYKAGHIYSIQIRTVDEMLAKYFKKQLQHEYTEAIKALSIDCRTILKRKIKTLYTITPTVVKMNEGGYWQDKDISLDRFEAHILNNLIKKYNQFTQDKIDENFEWSTGIVIKNRKPIGLPYKGITLFGDKVDVSICDDEQALELAYFALGVGLGELGARGCGFVNYK